MREYRTFTELASQYGTDKGTTRGHAHHYTFIYDVLFAPLRLEPIHLLEVGLAIGGPEHGMMEPTSPSVPMWPALGQTPAYDLDAAEPVPDLQLDQTRSW